MQGGFQPRPFDQQCTSGPGSSAFKYDILTALLVTSAQGPAVEARLSLRLALLITARFNWRRGTFSVGQREIARMWGVTERTAKREMAAMRALNWIVLDRPAARGRVATYRIELPVILRTTAVHWDAVGPDFAARMVGAPDPLPDSNVVPITTRIMAMPEPDDTGWAEAAQYLKAQDVAVYDAWFSGLQSEELEAGTLTLTAPSRFVATYVSTHFKMRILTAIRRTNPDVHDIRLGFV